MSAVPQIFDRRAVRRHRERAARTVQRVAPVLREAAVRLVDRLDDTTVEFRYALDLGGRGAVAPLLRARGIATVSADLSPHMAMLSGPPAVAADEELLPFSAESFDLVIANLSLHWVNDLPGALVQIRRALSPDGLFLASLPVLGALEPLRTALVKAEADLRGGTAPRISPFPTLGDCAGLLQRAGFAAPVADREVIQLVYNDPLSLLYDLRSAGETNAISLRDRRVPPRALFVSALAALPRCGDRISIDLPLAMLSGWMSPTPRSCSGGSVTG